MSLGRPSFSCQTAWEYWLSERPTSRAEASAASAARATTETTILEPRITGTVHDRTRSGMRGGTLDLESREQEGRDALEVVDSPLGVDVGRIVPLGVTGIERADANGAGQVEAL